MKYIYFFFILFLLSCKQGKELRKNDYPVVNFDRDSVFYEFKTTDRRIENFLVTREIVVKDSVFGRGESYDNWNNAYDYSYNIAHKDPDYLYKVYYYENNAYQKITEIVTNIASIHYITLKWGIQSELNKNWSEAVFSSPEYLRVIYTSDFHLNTRAINFSYNEGKWSVMSVEKLEYVDNQLIYCIDTLSYKEGEESYSNKRFRFSSLYYGDCKKCKSTTDR